MFVAKLKLVGHQTASPLIELHNQVGASAESKEDLRACNLFISAILSHNDLVA